MKYVVLGSSAAGINGVRELRRQDADGEITMITRDRSIYSRCILHHYLSGVRTQEQLYFAEPDFAARYRVNCMYQTACTGIIPEKKQVLTDRGEVISYDKLLIATGSHSFLPPIPNLREAKNVIGFRNIEDIDRIKEMLTEPGDIVVMGAGLVGLDCVSGLLHLGFKPALVETAGWLLPKQLDEAAAKTYQDYFDAHGIKQYYGVMIREIQMDREGYVSSVLLSDGRTLPCRYLIATAGVRANVGFLQDSGIETDRFGLVFDEQGRTNLPDIYGAGDVSGRNPIWPVAVKEGIIAAGNMAGVPGKMTDFFVSKSTMNFAGIPTMSLGEVIPKDDTYTVESCKTENSYRKVIHKDGVITGAIIQGDLSYSGILLQLIARRINIEKVKKPILDVDYSDFFHMKENFEFDYEGGF